MIGSGQVSVGALTAQSLELKVYAMSRRRPGPAGDIAL